MKIISVKNVSKTFTETSLGIKELFVRRSSGLDNFKFNLMRKYALKDISFNVYKSSGLAIIGHNGSGKSTLLSLLLGTYIQDSGSIDINGRISSLLELGAGFNNDLTGSENISLYGHILGMEKSQIDHLYPKIIDFCELGDAINIPLRKYSAGMIARLGFAIAIFNNPDILLIDEVLAVGDSSFKKKCYQLLNDYRNNGGTLIIVSHEINELTNYCDRAIVLKNGEIFFSGKINIAIDKYNSMMI